MGGGEGGGTYVPTREKTQKYKKEIRKYNTYTISSTGVSTILLFLFLIMIFKHIK